MTTEFQTAVRGNVSREHRHAAIDDLREADDRSALAVVVRTDGLRGEFRRAALDALAERDARDRLEELAGDTTLPASLRRSARDGLR